jgi:hypothetical protein
MKKSLALVCLLLTLVGMGSTCDYFISETKICNDLRSVFFDDKVQASDNLLACLDGYWASEELPKLQKKNQMTFKRVIEDQYFSIKDIHPSSWSEAQQKFIEGVDASNENFSEPELIHLFSSKISFSAEKEEKAEDKQAPKNEGSIKDDFQKFIDGFKK